jgi:lysophospholipase L1-like esterase
MAPEGGGRLRGLAINLSLSAAAVVVVFGAAELVLRVTGLAPAGALRSPDLETLDAIPGIYAPGQQLTDRVRPELPSRIRVNSLGFRGREIAEAKAPGTLRVMVLGDSYTFGDHVNTEEAWPARLEESLTQRIAGLPVKGAPVRGAEIRMEVTLGEAASAARRPSSVEVINAGVNGFGILDEERLWEKAGERLRPDIVVITFSPNDFPDMARPALMYDQMRSNAGLKSRFLIGPLLRLAQHTAIFNGLQILRARMIVAWARRASHQEEGSAREREDEWTAGWRGAFMRLAAEIKGQGRRVLLVIYPSYPHVVGAEPLRAGADLPGWAQEAGVESLDLLPALQKAAQDGERLYLVPLDSHPAPAGHRVAAEAVAEKLESLGWLGEPGSEGAEGGR